MKTAMTGFSFPSELSVIEKMKLAKRAGLDGIEISIVQEGQISAQSSDEDLLFVKQAAQNIGIKIHSLSCSMSWQCSTTSESKDIRERAKSNIRMQIHHASILGADAILTLPGFVGVDFKTTDLFADPNHIEYFVGSEIIDYDVAWTRAIEAYRELAPFAENHGVKIGIENIWSRFLISPLEMRQFIEEIGSKYVGVYLDTGNMMLFGYPEQWIKILGSHIVRVHLKDFRRGAPTLAGFVDLLSGDVDFIKVFKALSDIGYDGWVTGEITPYKQYPEQTIFNTSASMNVLLGRTR